jgi:hypothetical protein
MFRSKKTVASVLVGFTKVLDDLDEVTQQSLDVVHENSISIAALTEESSRASAEAESAQIVRRKLAAIVEA